MESGRRELFDLSVDPAELNDVADREPKLVTFLQTSLDEWTEDAARARRGETNSAILDDERKRALEALGYSLE